MLTKSMTALVAMGLMASASAFAHPNGGNKFGYDHHHRGGGHERHDHRDRSERHGVRGSHGHGPWNGRRGWHPHYVHRPAFVEVRVVAVRPVVRHVVVARRVVERRAGYDVTYEYAGRRLHTHLEEAPGAHIRLQLGIVLGG